MYEKQINSLQEGLITSVQMLANRLYSSSAALTNFKNVNDFQLAAVFASLPAAEKEQFGKFEDRFKAEFFDSAVYVFRSMKKEFSREEILDLLAKTQLVKNFDAVAEMIKAAGLKSSPSPLQQTGIFAEADRQVAVEELARTALGENQCGHKHAGGFACLAGFPGI